MSSIKKYASIIVALAAIVIPVVPLLAGPADPPPAAPAAVPTQTLQTPLTEPSTNPSSSAFKIAVCDGPTLPNDLIAKAEADLGGRSYVPCDFNAVMLLIQHLINIMMVVGVLVAILMFTYAGGLMVSGKEKNISLAKSIFPKVFIGFIIMLSAWFIVYQVLSWLSDNAAFKSLLGSP